MLGRNLKILCLSCSAPMHIWSIKSLFYCLLVGSLSCLFININELHMQETCFYCCVLLQSFKHAKARFATADRNGDKQLDLSEYAAFNNPQDYPFMSDVEADRVLADYDTDGDGKVTEEEYLSNAVFAKSKSRVESPCDVIWYRYAAHPWWLPTLCMNGIICTRLRQRLSLRQSIVLFA